MTSNGPLTTAEAEDLVGVLRQQLYRWRDAGLLTARKVGGQRGVLLWDREPLEQIRRQRAQPKPPTKAELRRRAWAEKEAARLARNAALISAWQTGQHTQYDLDRKFGLPLGSTWRILQRAKSPS